MSDQTQTSEEIRRLPLGERFLLWAIRQWVRDLKTEDKCHATLRDGFQKVGIEEGYFVIDEWLSVIASTTTTCIDVRCPQCPGISTDEKTLIAVVAALQKADTSTSAALLETWLPPSVVWLAQRPAAQLARLMDGLGLVLGSQQSIKKPSKDGVVSDSACDPQHPNLHAEHATVQ